MLNANGPETHLPHTLHFKFFAQTMLNSNELHAPLSHKPRYKFITQAMVNTNELETYFYLINHVINLSQKPC